MQVESSSGKRMQTAGPPHGMYATTTDGGHRPECIWYSAQRPTEASSLLERSLSLNEEAAGTSNRCIMIHKTKGIVFRFVRFRESSIIVTIFTELFGLQSYIVNGARS